MTKLYRRNHTHLGVPDGQDDLYGQARVAEAFGAAADDMPHGLCPSDIEKLDKRGSEILAEAMRPPPGRNQLQERLQNVLPNVNAKSALARRADASSGNPGGGGNVFTSNQFYEPTYSSIDRQSYPRDRRKANTWWRMFQRQDPTIGAVIEMRSTLPFSDFQLIGEGVDGSIKDTIEQSLREMKIHELFPALVGSYLTTGEAIPHATWDDDKSMWTKCIVHNPDDINVVYSPIIDMDPIIEYVPDATLRTMSASADPRVQKAMLALPAKLLASLRSGENIPLTPVTTTFIPRKLQHYDLRGTSILSRLFRALMAEDALWNAVIQVMRRQANPLRVVKLGDPTTGAIPPPSEEQRVLEKLAQCEQDPNAIFSYNHMIQFEQFGGPDRVLPFSMYYDAFDAIKMVALGVSKSFLLGEASYSSSAAGLTIFLQSLKATRTFFEQEWLIPKILLPMAIMNDWIKPARKAHVKPFAEGQSMDDIDINDYIVPQLQWSKSLDPQIDRDMIDAMVALEQSLGIKISDQKKFACLGLDNEENQKQQVEEIKFKRQLAGKDPYLQTQFGLAQDGGAPSLSPGIPGDSFGGAPMPSGGDIPPTDTGVSDGVSTPIPDEGGGEPGGEQTGEPPAPPPAAGLEATADDGDEDNTKPAYKPLVKKAPQKQQAPDSYWPAKALTPLKKLMYTFDESHVANVSPWVYAMDRADIQEALATQNSDKLFAGLEDFLVEQNYDLRSIEELNKLFGRTAFTSKQAATDKAVLAEINLLDEGNDPLLGM